MSKSKKVDCLIGNRIKVLRECAGVSRTQLASKIGISSPQMKKYEEGVNRITVSTLLKISETLCIPVWSFIEDEDGNIIDSKEQRALYYWRSLNHPALQTGFTDLMKNVCEVNGKADSLFPKVTSG